MPFNLCHLPPSDTHGPIPASALYQPPKGKGEQSKKLPTSTSGQALGTGHIPGLGAPNCVLTIQVVLRRDHFALFEELICLLVHHQQLGLIPSSLDGRYHIAVLFALHADPIDL